MLSLEKIKKILSSEILPHIDDQNTKHAAVMVVICGEESKIIMTEKPKTLSLHAGEISFPGGKRANDDEDLLDTALRETKEEISLGLRREDVIGQLHHVKTRNSGFTIIPFVAVLPEVPTLNANPEVEEILQMPLFSLLKTLRLDEDEEHKSLFEAYVLTYYDKIVWGASARILKQISDLFKQSDLI